MIDLKNVSKTIGNEEVLNDITLELKKGKIYGFVGRNGSGKSMLFKAICGFIIPTKGRILIDGKDINETGSFPNDIRALIEKPSFLPDISGIENLQVLAKIQNKIGIEEIEKTLRDVGLVENKDKKVKNYSMGMKQKLGIAQVLMENPKILVLDEPFNGLDKSSVEELRKTLLLKKREGRLILVASHIKEDIEILCDEVYYMDAGKIVDHKKLER
jgi:ABC-2 type transport system ATP-binding protein